jgi:hypothetical protein
MPQRFGGGIEKYVSRTMKLRVMVGDYPPWMAKHRRRLYIVTAILSAPLWMRRRDLRHLREQAIRETERTGVPHVLDHIIPLRHPYVCGLTVPWNLRVVPHKVNVAKNGSWHPDQLSMDLPHEAKQHVLPL